MDWSTVLDKVLASVVVSNVTLIEAARVCKRWRNAVYEETVWAVKCRREFSFEGVSDGNKSFFRRKYIGFYMWKSKTRIYQEYFYQTIAPEDGGLEIFNGFGTGLVWKGRGLYYVTADGFDSSLFKFLHELERRTPDFEQELEKLRFLLNNGNFDTSTSLLSQLGLFLKILAVGNYRISIYPSKSIFGWKDITDWRGYSFAETQDKSLIKPERVAFYEAKIKSGERPIVLVASIRREKYILDGHHKMRAYANLDITPSFISITLLVPESRFPPPQSCFSPYWKWVSWVSLPHVPQEHRSDPMKWTVSAQEIKMQPDDHFFNDYVKQHIRVQEYKAEREAKAKAKEAGAVLTEEEKKPAADATVAKGENTVSEGSVSDSGVREGSEAAGVAVGDLANDNAGDDSGGGKGVTDAKDVDAVGVSNGTANSDAGVVAVAVAVASEVVTGGSGHNNTTEAAVAPDGAAVSSPPPPPPPVLPAADEEPAEEEYRKPTLQEICDELLDALLEEAIHKTRRLQYDFEPIMRDDWDAKCFSF